MLDRGQIMHRYNINVLIYALGVAILVGNPVSGPGAPIQHGNARQPNPSIIDSNEPDQPYWVAFSADSDWMATGTREGEVNITGVIDGHRWPHKIPQLGGSVECLDFNPECTPLSDQSAKILAVATADGAITLINGDGSTFKLYTGERKNMPTAVAFGGADGDLLAAGFNDGRVIVWQLQSNQAYTNIATVPEYIEPVKPVLTLAFTGDGQDLAIGYANSAIALFEGVPSALKAGPEMLQGHKDAVNWIAFGDGGQFLVSASNDKTVKRWDLSASSQNPPSTLLPIPNSAAADAAKAIACYSKPFNTHQPEYSRVAAGYADGYIRIWESVDNQPHFATAIPPHDVNHSVVNTIYCVAISPDGKYLAAVSADSRLRVFDLDLLAEQRPTSPSAQPPSAAAAAQLEAGHATIGAQPVAAPSNLGANSSPQAAAQGSAVQNVDLQFQFDNASSAYVKTDLTINVRAEFNALSSNGQSVTKIWSVTGFPDRLAGQSMQLHIADLATGQYELTLTPSCSGVMVGAPLTAIPVSFAFRDVGKVDFGGQHTYRRRVTIDLSMDASGGHRTLSIRNVSPL
jgi:WD40 repeat protein